MTIAQSLFKNTLARIVTEIINRLGGAVFWMMVARQLGLSTLGVLAYGLALFSFFHTLSTLGLGAVVVRDVARDRSNAALYFGHTLVAGCLLAGIAAIIMIGLGTITARSNDSQLVVIFLACALLPGSIFFWSKSILSAAEKMHHIAIACLLENLFKVTLGIGLLVWNGDVLSMAIVLLFSKTMSALMAFVYARRVAKPVWSLDTNLLYYFARLIPTFSMTALTNSLFWAAPVIILTRTAGEDHAGMFGVAYKLVDMVISLALAYGQALFPVASRTLIHKRDSFVVLLTGTVKYSLMLTIAIAASLTFLAPMMMPIFFGAESMSAVPVLRLLIWMIVPFALIPALAYSLVSHHSQKIDVLANSAAAFSVIASGFVLAPSFGAMGTAVSLLIGTVAFWLIEWIGVQKKLCRLPLLQFLWRPLLGAVLMATILNIEILTPLCSITLAGSIYILFLILSKALSKHELLLIQKLKSA